jgi:very-short-patch-repair endonuclease
VDGRRGLVEAGLPNSGSTSRGVLKEPDFLVFYKGKVGVLEVDGPTHVGRAADDSARDGYFQRHGLFVKHYPSEMCSKQPEIVLRDFLGLLVKS